jgi:hypothetical protein
LEKLKTAFAAETTSDEISQALLSIIESVVDEANADSGDVSSERDRFVTVLLLFNFHEEKLLGCFYFFFVFLFFCFF